MSQTSMLPPTGLDGRVLEAVTSGVAYRSELLRWMGVLLVDLDESVDRLKAQGLIEENDYRELSCA